jgi:hypothetical protein
VTHSETGGAPVSSYGLEWDAGTGQATWESLAGSTSSYLEAEFIVSTGVSPGATYAVRVSANNAHGWGAASPVTLVAANAAPDSTPAPTTAISGLVNVRVAWVAAYANSEPLDAYEVLLATSSGAFVAELSSCDGASAGPLSNNFCDIPLLTLRAAPFNLAQGQAVIA